MFEKASRLKLSFETARGIASVSDLWDLGLTKGVVNLDDIAKGLNRQLKESSEESFVVQKTSKNEILELKLEIVKHIIKVKLTEKEERENEELKKAQKEKIARILDGKRDSELMGKSIEELEAMIA